MKMKLNSLEKTDNPNQAFAKFVVHDFLPSWYGDVITREVCQENLSTLIGQYICCGYISREDNNGEDALLDHMVTKEIDRNTGRERQNTMTTPIGHITNAYIARGINSNGEEDDVLYCEAILWLDKFRNVIGLLDEWLTNGINIPCSCEYSFMNYNVVDGVSYIQSPIYYKGHCILNAEQRGDVEEMLPAYDCSKLVGYGDVFNQALKMDLDTKTELDNQDSVNSIEEEGKGDGMETEEIKVEDVATEEVKQEEVTDPDTSEEVVPVEEVAEPQVEPVVESEVEPVVDELSAAKDRIRELEEACLESKNAQVELSATIEALNAQVEALRVCEKELNEIRYNERLEEAKLTYRAEFETFNGIEKFESEEVQKLIAETLVDETAFNAIVKLKDTLLECAKENKPSQESFNSVEASVVEKSKSIKNLMPEVSNTEKYGFRI